MNMNIAIEKSILKRNNNMKGDNFIRSYNNSILYLMSL